MTQMTTQKAISILAKSNIGIQEASVFLACSSQSRRQIEIETGQMNVRMKLNVLKCKGLIQKTNDRKPLYFRTQEGEKIIQSITS